MAATRWQPVALALGAFVAVRVVGLAVLVAAAHERGRAAHPVLVKWDGQWYAGIAGHGYGFTRLDQGRLLADYAFFPMLPWLERGVAAATGLGFADAGLVVSVLASVVAAWGVFAVTRELYGDRVGVVTVVLWAALPVASVQWMAYTESLFTAFAAWALLAVLRRRWLAAAVLACGAGLTRPVGAAVAAAVAVSAVVHVVRRGGQSDEASTAGGSGVGTRDLRPLAAAALAPLGTVGYVAWVGLARGSLTGYFDVTAGWHNGIDGGRAFALWIGHLLTGPSPASGALVLLALAVLGGALWLCFRQRQPLPLLVYTTVLVALALVTSGYFGSKPRYLLPGFPLLLPPARWIARARPTAGGSVLVGLVVGSAVYGATWLLGSGPP